MRAFITSLLSTLALCAFAGQTQLTNLRPTHLVVTNEQDATALSALATTSTAVRALLDIETGLRTQADADLSAALSASNTAARSAITNEAALRAQADASLFSSNTAARAAITNEAALRALADASLFSSNTAARAAITNEAALRALADATNAESLHALISTSQVTIVHDTLDHHVFTRSENGTGVTYRVSDPSWWAIQQGYAYPMPELPYPLELGTFGVIQVSLAAENITNIWFESIANVVERSESTHYEWPDWNTVLDYHSVTTEISRVATKNDIGSGLSAVRLNPVVSNLYADLASTNVAGYASFSTVNPSAQTMTVIPASTIATNSVDLRYDIGSDGFVSASSVLFGRGQAIREWTTVLTLRDQAGTALASNVFYGASPRSTATLPYFTNNLVWRGPFLTNAYLTLTCTIAKTNKSGVVCWIASGDVSASPLAITTHPLHYAAPDQLPLQPFYRRIQEIPAVAPGETSIVPLSDGKDIYLVQSTNVQNSILHRDLGLALAGRQASWELWVNFAAAGGTNMTWCPCMRWAEGAPEISVTGLYKFACSTLNGQTIQARQIYPTRYEWVPCTFGSANSAYQQNQSRYVTLLSVSASNAYCVVGIPSAQYPTALSLTYVCGGGSNPDLRLWVDYAFQATPPTTKESVSLPTAFDPGRRVQYWLDGTNTPADVVGYVRLTTSSFPSGNVSIHSPKTRRLNELELSVFSAGGRP